jgi:hypothetical protein
MRKILELTMPFTTISLITEDACHFECFKLCLKYIFKAQIQITNTKNSLEYLFFIHLLLFIDDDFREDSNQLFGFIQNII